MIEKIVNGYYDMVVEGVAKERNLSTEEVAKGFNKDLQNATAKVAIVIGAAEADDEPHIIYVDLAAFNGAIRDRDIQKFNELLQEKAKG